MTANGQFGTMNKGDLTDTNTHFPFSKSDRIVPEM